MKRQDVKFVVDYIARNHRATFPAAWDTGEGLQHPSGFALPRIQDVADAMERRDELVDEILKASEKVE